MATSSNDPLPDSFVPNGITLNKVTGTAAADRTPPLREIEPIAVCGIGLRLPGGVHDGDGFWQLLVNGRDARSEIPASRFTIDGFDASLAGKKAIHTKHGYFIDDDISRLDTSFFSMSRNEIERCDPQQRLLLEVVRECFEDAGEVAYRGQPIGCYVGTFGQDWYEMTTKDLQSMGNYAMMGCGDLVLANRVSYEFDLRGPSLVVKTGCSASLVALHDACRALQSGDISAAVVCGTSLIMTPTTMAIFFSEGVLSPDASCKTFDAAANGFARAEGITAVYIKRLDDALRDGNPIRAVIRNTGSNSDGRSQGLMSPNGQAHEALMRKVYQQASLNPSETAFVECHGTGTPIGDPIEVGAVGNVFGNDGVYIGSVKPNVGHSEGCSGLTSLIKAVLALENRTIPPNIKFLNPNPHIPFSEKKLTVPLAPTAFPKNRAERISINSFGIGGSNAHVIVDSAFEYLHKSRRVILRTNGINGTNGLNGSRAACPSELLLFSANSLASLSRQMDSYQEYAVQHPHRTKDVAYTLALHREKLPHKAFAIVQDGDLLEISAQAKAPTSSPVITMVFSGQGAQWPGMGRELLLTSASFRHDIILMDGILQGLRIPPKWSILDELLKPEELTQIHRAELSQPLCTALQVGLVRHLQRLGITPSTVVGHSSGEIAAAYAAGYISLEYAITVAYYRGYVTSRGNTALSGGMMAAVGLGAAEVSHFLQAGACVACENSPSSTTISGDAKAVQKTLASILTEYPEVLTRPLKVDMAYHSHHMAALAAEYLDLLNGEDSRDPHRVSHNTHSARFFSSVTAKLINDGTPLASPYYWVINLVSPVRFSNAVFNLLSHDETTDSSNVLLEIGPHSALAGPLRQICEAVSQPCNYIPSQIRGKDSVASLLSALGRLYQESVPVNWKPLFPECSKALAGLPTYPWDHSSGPFWYENRLSKAWRTRKFPQHCLLGVRVVESPDTAPQWRNVLNLEHVPWLSDHRVRQDVVFPFAGYIAMAGEAVRQTTGCETGYRLRHVVARTALVLTDAEPAEMVTTLRQQRLTDTDESAWFDFVIASYTGSTWVKHCEGQAMPLDQARSPTDMVGSKPLPRVVANTRFYDAVGRAGLMFGQEFQRLTDITTSISDGVAQAKLAVSEAESNKPFPGPLHPASIDACIQLLLVASVQGLCRNLRQLVVPTLIETVEISHGSDQMHITAVSPPQGLGSADVECVTEDNRLSLRMAGLQVTALESDSESPAAREPIDAHAAAHLRWLPDLDLAPLSELIKPPVRNPTERQLNELLTLLCILESADQLAPLTPSQPHFTKYRAWLNHQTALAQTGTYPLVDDAATYAALPPPARRALLDSTYTQLLTTTTALPDGASTHAASRGIKRVSDHAAALFTGARDTLDLLMHDGLLTDVYNADAFDYGGFARLLAHARPGLRVLEVGAGTGGTTELLLRHLAGEGASAGDGGAGGSGFLPGYKEYMFTDVSAGFFPQAKERFREAPNMEFRALDISRDAVAQGFVPGSYDLVVAPNVVHATPCLRETLANLRVLLKDDGMLLLTEVATVTRMPTFIFGNFGGWWLGEEDGRVWEPYVMPERWDEELKAAGFTGVDAVVADGEMPWQMCVVMLSRPSTGEPKVPERNVTVLCQNATSGPATSLISGLREESWNVTPCQLGELPPPGNDIIACVDLESRFFDQDTLTEDGFSSFQALLRHLKDRNHRILWLTPPFQVKCRDPRGAQALGVMRTIRAEHGLPLFTLELDYDREGQHAARLIAEVFTKKVQHAQDGDILNADREFAIDNGTLLVGRYHPFSLTDARTLSSADTTSEQPPPGDANTAKTLRIAQPGNLSTLAWTTTPLPATLPPNHVQVQVHSAALNFRDILLATGSLRAPNATAASTPELGLEASGVVTRTSSNRFRPGDRVILVSPTSTLTTSLVAPADLVVRVPATLPLAAAAAAPVCYATVLHALLEVGRLRPGMSVLVHSACGGVGLAAMEVCCRAVAGVQVYATVGSEDKVGFLLGRYPAAVRPERVFSSRDGGFRDGVMRETGGRGVDLVLNSLSGDLLHASWGCVARYGMMVELGKRDLIGAGRLDMAPFLENRAYAGVDLYQYMCERPERVGELLARYVDMFEQGLLRLPDPVAYFEAEQVEQAFRHLQNGAHIGKVVITLPENPSVINSLPPARSVSLDPEATYLLVGGSKGLGGSMASWLVDQGARNLTVLSRSAGLSSESKALFEELRAMGCSVHLVAGSIESKEDVETAISISGKPVKGVFQLAMVMNDAPLLDMKWSQWNATLGPKVRGTWILHEALADQPLDFFWMASSIVTVVDEPGQCNYSAGCIFLEAFCQYRHSLGLPAAVLNICPVEGVGYVAENPQARRNMKAQGICLLGEPEFLDFVQLNLLQAGLRSSSGGAGLVTDTAGWENPNQVIMGLKSGSELHLDDPNNRTNWRRDRRMGRYHNVRMDGRNNISSSKPDQIVLFLDSILAVNHSAAGILLGNPENIAFLAREIGKKIYELILKPVEDDEAVDTRLTLPQIGLDSLMAIELRRWLRRVLGIGISVLEIMGSGSLIQLGVVVAGKLAENLTNE